MAFRSRLMLPLTRDSHHAPPAFISAVFRYELARSALVELRCAPSLLGVNRLPVRHRSWDFSIRPFAALIPLERKIKVVL